MVPMIKPALSDAHVRFRGIKYQIAVFGKQLSAALVLRLRAHRLQAFGIFFARLLLLIGGVAFTDYAPLALARNAGFIAHPAHFAAHVCRHAVGLQVPDKLFPRVHVVFKIFRHFLAARAVHPHAEDLALSVTVQIGTVISVQKLRELIHIKLVICFRVPVRLRVHVPGGEIYAHLQAVFFTAFGEHLHHVALPVFPFAVFHAVLRGVSLPQAKTVMMLCREDYPLAAGGFERLAPLVGAQIFRVKVVGIFLARAPLVAGKGVHAEVGKVVIFKFQIIKLTLRRRDGNEPLYFRVVFGVTVIGIAKALVEFMPRFIGMFFRALVIIVFRATGQHARQHGDDQRKRYRCQDLFHDFLLFYGYADLPPL